MVATKKSPVKRPAKPRNKPAAKPSPEKDSEDNGQAEPDPTAGMVQPLRKESLKVLLTILDNAQITGSQARIIIELRRELYAVAGVDVSG